MREVLFRGRRIDNGEWVEGNLITSKNGAPDSDFAKILAKDKHGYSVAWHEVDMETIGQWTCLVDKNGVKIFEGDIGRNIDGKFLICWNEEKAAFVMVLQEYPYETLYLEEMWEDTEVIGNIHDEKAVEE